VLERMRQRYRFVVIGYVVMPEHFHLLVSEPQEEHALNGDAGHQAGGRAP
jgi:REP element-mobilizing transposase RayT